MKQQRAGVGFLFSSSDALWLVLVLALGSLFMLLLLLLLLLLPLETLFLGMFINLAKTSKFARTCCGISLARATCNLRFSDGQ